MTLNFNPITQNINHQLDILYTWSYGRGRITGELREKCGQKTFLNVPLRTTTNLNLQMKIMRSMRAGNRERAEEGR